MTTDPSDNNTKQDPETNISTLVFLDFESTSLLDKKCRITELCLLAVNRIDMNATGNFPRVTNKLTLCLDPQMPISMTSSYMTGLFNDSLEYQQALTEETVKLINAFLNCLSKPVCLLAHNGNRFDFPLLVSELKRINQSLEESLLCADTLEAFRSLDGLPARYDLLANHNSGKKSHSSPIKNNVTPLKSVTPTAQSPAKRKGTNDLEVLNNKSPKFSRQDIAQKDKNLSDETKLSVEKAKKKLEFNEMKTDMKMEFKRTVEHENEDTGEKDEAVEEFSASLEDADYLLALENVENGMCKEKLVFGESIKETENVCNTKKESEILFPDNVCKTEKQAEILSPENVCRTKKEAEFSSPKNVYKDKKGADNGGKISGCSAFGASTTPLVSAQPCCVANGTGYIVRHNTDEPSNSKKIVTKSADNPVKRLQSNTGALPVCLDKTSLQAFKTSVSVIKAEGNVDMIEKVRKAANQKHSTETNFSFTIRPHNDSVVCDQTTPSKTLNDSSKTDYSKSSLSVSKPAHCPNYSDAIAGTTNTACDFPRNKIESSRLDALNGSNLSRKLNEVPSAVPVMSKTTELTLGCSTVTKPCQIGIPDKPSGSGASRSALYSVANESKGLSVKTTLSSVANLPTSSVLESTFTSVVNVPTPLTTGKTLTPSANKSMSSISGSSLSTGANVANLSKMGSTPAIGVNEPSSSKSVSALTVTVPNGSHGFQRQSYKLEEICFRKFGFRPPQAHKAEDDCVTMVRIAKCSSGFLEWVNSNAVLLTAVQTPF